MTPLRKLLTQMRHRDCTMVTTAYLAEEAAEHARWAQRKVAEAGSWQSAPVLDALLGASGERSNDFLLGFVSTLDAGLCPADFGSFLSQCFAGVTIKGEVTNADVAAGLEALGVRVISRLESVDGYTRADFVNVDTHKANITIRRQSNATLTHARQVSAEAEALALVEGLREGRLRVGAHRATGAYFVSHSQFLNDLTTDSLPPVLRQEAALQWLMALRGHGPAAAAAVYDGLLWELQERRADLVDKTLLRRVFKPTIDAAKEDLAGELERYRYNVAAAAGATGEVDDLDAPRVVASAVAQTTAALEAKLAQAEARIYNLEHELEAKSANSARERQEKKAKGTARYQRRQARRGGNRS